MKLNSLLPLFLIAVFSCTTPVKNEKPVREPQQITLPLVELKDEDEKIQSSFKALMNQPNDAERSRAAAKFLDRQRDFYYIAHGLLNTFDKELEKVYHLKQQGIELTSKDLEKFEKASFQMRIAREFSERNLHEPIGIYSLALEQANNPDAEFHRASGWIVANVNDWLKEGAKKGDSSATINLAQHLDDVNKSFRAELKSGGKQIIGIPSFEKIYSVNREALALAHKQSLNYAADRQQTLFDSFIGQEWVKYQAERNENSDVELNAWTEKNRLPQALDTLYPDAGGAGHVTGNRFPPKTWAITLDDGPHPTHTAGMFEVLRNAGMTGTFFWQTQNMLKYPKFSAEAKQLGFNQASHSYTHANLPKQSQSSLNHEINDAFDDFQKVVGSQPTLFRCPYGACGPMGSNIRQMIAARNALHIAWNVDTLDWQDKNPQSIFERTKKQMEVSTKGIVLFHDIHPQSVIALKLVTDYIKQRGFIVKALPTIIGEVREKAYASP